MVPQFVFQVGEQTVQGICRIRDVKFSPLLKNEQMRQVRYKASVCASELFMRIMRLACLFVYSPFIQHMLPFFEPSVRISANTFTTPFFPSQIIDWTLMPLETISDILLMELLYSIFQRYII